MRRSWDNFHDLRKSRKSGKRRHRNTLARSLSRSLSRSISRSLSRSVSRSVRRKTNRRHRKWYYGGNVNGVYPPEPSNQIGGSDPRYTFNQPVTNMLQSGQHALKSTFDDFMGRTHSVAPSVLDQPYLSHR